MTDIFEAVKAIPIDRVLASYGIEVPKGAEVRIPCPLHHGEQPNVVAYRSMTSGHPSIRLLYLYGISSDCSISS